MLPHKATFVGIPITILNYDLEKERTIILENVIFGDVFVCSGQSNMEIVVYNNTFE